MKPEPLSKGVFDQCDLGWKKHSQTTMKSRMRHCCNSLSVDGAREKKLLRNMNFVLATV